ncbi:hypothetical protein C0Q61_08130 [Streptomyces albidoflavus]|nr:hypothetical protein C0Q61_08130 [Streptomyces albidoflavus]
MAVEEVPQGPLRLQKLRIEKKGGCLHGQIGTWAKRQRSKRSSMEFIQSNIGSLESCTDRNVFVFQPLQPLLFLCKLLRKFRCA